MKFRNSPFLLALAALAVVVLAGILIRSPSVYADDDNNESKIQVGFKIAPVPLNLDGKNRALVGLGSYIVNAQGDCNGCHSAGPATEFAPGGNPYFGQPEKVNPASRSAIAALGCGVRAADSIPARNSPADWPSSSINTLLQGNQLKSACQLVKCSLIFNSLLSSCTQCEPVNGPASRAKRQ